jgi:hypothetical protein
MVFQEKIAPPGPLPATTEPSDVLHFQRTIDSLENENAWLKEQLARAIRDSKQGRLSWRPLSFVRPLSAPFVRPLGCRLTGLPYARKPALKRTGVSRRTRVLLPTSTRRLPRRAMAQTATAPPRFRIRLSLRNDALDGAETWTPAANAPMQTTA